jgi:hypothetical protein
MRSAVQINFKITSCSYNGQMMPTAIVISTSGSDQAFRGICSPNIHCVIKSNVSAGCAVVV